VLRLQLHPHREEVTPDGIFLVPPDAPGLGLELDGTAVAAASLVPA
jgi:hypothetical protein